MTILYLFLQKKIFPAYWICLLILPAISFPLFIYQSEVFLKLFALNTSKACGPDGICLHLHKEGANELAKSLATLYK